MSNIRLLILILLFGLASCDSSTKIIKPYDPNIRYAGRVDLADIAAPRLISSASFVEFSFDGTSCEILLGKFHEGPDYFSIELDGKYQKRIRIEQDSIQSYIVNAKNKGSHLARIVKETEAGNGSIVFGGVRNASLIDLPALSGRKIEFIGNSITCGMGADVREIPCHTGVWYDQHNAYWAYGPRAARALNAQFMLSSVSGIGMYRNWNGVGAIMPQVYQNRYLNTEDEYPYGFNTYTPDLVTICLGTNDLSDGDGIRDRLPFDPEKFTANYIEFVRLIYSKYPAAQLCLLTSPMVEGEKRNVLLKCLVSVKQHFLTLNKEIAIFDFDNITPHGCDYHPDMEDHRKMADQLIPFLRDLMNWNESDSTNSPML